MNLTQLHRQSVRQIGRVKKVVRKNVKKLQRAKNVMLMALTIPLVIPVGAVTAAYSTEVPTPVTEIVQFESELTLALNDKVVDVPVKTVQIELKESEYQRRVRVAREAKKASQSKSTVSKPAELGDNDKFALASQAAAKYGIPASLLFAVWKVESGQRMYFEGGSTVGARGPCQFMPGTWRSYQEDGNGDGVKNINDARDCLYGSSKLLARNGASSGDYRRALFAYNHSTTYVNQVLKMAGL
ncbi:MAG: lytic transglycosylase domain-containing protein [Candidatus Berkelbacteria bacterium]|nr:MAG: lytic transglycosylase domain-containing protein [Candidatus Berkelbacteria bacterium]QQG51407.1 MAG: lytic transglycosylase domain-containing protein [Candidatus Berkelbacteria bacterium]